MVVDGVSQFSHFRRAGGAVLEGDISGVDVPW